MVCSGRQVTGSTIMPDSERLTLSTSRGLRLDRQVLVDDAEAALLGHGDRQARLGDRVHRGRDDRDVQADLAVRLVRRSTSRGWTSEWPGRSRTSSKVSASGMSSAVASVFAGV